MIPKCCLPLQPAAKYLYVQYIAFTFFLPIFFFL